jgi:hypothetical protein
VCVCVNMGHSTHCAYVLSSIFSVTCHVLIKTYVDCPGAAGFSHNMTVISNATGLWSSTLFIPWGIFAPEFRPRAAESDVAQAGMQPWHLWRVNFYRYDWKSPSPHTCSDSEPPTGPGWVGLAGRHEPRAATGIPALANLPCAVATTDLRLGNGTECTCSHSSVPV